MDEQDLSGGGRGLEDPSLSNTAGSAYIGLILEQLTEERATKKSLEQRGTGIITSSGTLVTLLLAFAAVVTSSKAFELPTVARIFVGISVTLFIAAAFAAIAANLPRPYAEVSLRDVRRLITDDEWRKPIAQASMATAEVQLIILETARRYNAARARLLELAATSQIVSLVSLAIAAGFVVGISPPAMSLVRITTSSQTFCGTLVKGDNGNLTIDDQFRHSIQTVQVADIRTESVGLQECSK